MVWDIQIIFNAFIVMMLELGGGFRCDARRGAGATLLNRVDGSFSIILNLDHVDEVAQAVALGLVVLRGGFVLGELETHRGGWPAMSEAPFRSRYDHEICTKSCRTTDPSWLGRSVVGSGYLLIRLTLNRTYQS